MSYELNPQELKDHGYVSERGKVNTYKVASRLKGEITEEHKFTFVTIPLIEKDLLFVYKNGVYVPGDPLVRAEAQRFLNEFCGIHTSNEIIGHLKRMPLHATHLQFDDDSDWINLKNTWLNVRTLELRKHDSVYWSLVQLPIKYDSKAECPIFQQCVEDWIRPEESHLLQEMFGYCLWKNYKFRKAFFLLGEGHNGKSTCVEILRELLGKENCSHTGIKEIETYGFAVARLAGKMANIVSELPAKRLRKSDRFKALTGNDAIDASLKNIQEPIRFKNYAKLIFLANTIPMTDDDTDAFYERVIIIHFIQQFIEGINADQDLPEKLLKELPGILNWSLEGLERLLINKRFSEEELTIDQKRERYQKLSEPTYAFVETWVEEIDTGHLYLKEAFTAHKIFCKNKGYSAEGRNAFYEKMRMYLGSSDVQDATGKRERYWRGFQLTDEAREIIQVKEYKNLEVQGIIEL